MVDIRFLEIYNLARNANANPNQGIPRTLRHREVKRLLEAKCALAGLELARTAPCWTKVTFWAS